MASSRGSERDIRDSAAPRQFLAALAFVAFAFVLALVVQRVDIEGIRRAEVEQATQNCRTQAENDGCDRLDNETRSANATEFAADIAAWQAFFSLLGIGFVGVTLVFTYQATQAANIAVRDAHRDFLATHRPRLRVRNFVLKPSDYDPAGPWMGQFYVSNVGGTEAKIVNSHCEAVRLRDLPMERPYEGRLGNNPIGGFLPSGSSRPAIFLAPSDLARNISGGELYLMGWIDYLDDVGIHRRTAFCRHYTKRDGGLRFYAVDDPDYEHEE
jgi:hypothetical protein